MDNVDHRDNVVDNLLRQNHHRIEHNHYNDLYYLYNDQMYI
jgi:hypothetical protein